MKYKSNKQVTHGRTYQKQYAFDGNPNSLSFQKVKQVATEIAMERMNEMTSVICNIAVMTFIDCMEDLGIRYPDIEVSTAEEFSTKFKQYMEDYDSGCFNKADLENYCRKNKIKDVWHS